MLNFSKTGLIDELITDIRALTADGNEVEQALCAQAITQAVSMLEAIRSETINGAHINLRAAIIWPLNSHQLEIQINGRKI